jgi:hypothetical protein
VLVSQFKIKMKRKQTISKFGKSQKESYQPAKQH